MTCNVENCGQICTVTKGKHGSAISITQTCGDAGAGGKPGHTSCWVSSPLLNDENKRSVSEFDVTAFTLADTTALGAKKLSHLFTRLKISHGSYSNHQAKTKPLMMKVIHDIYLDSTKAARDEAMKIEGNTVI